MYRYKIVSLCTNPKSGPDPRSNHRPQIRITAKITVGPTHADNFQVRISDSDNVLITSAADSNGTIEQSSSSTNVATPQKAPPVKFALFNKLKTYNNHQDQILHFAAI